MAAGHAPLQAEGAWSPTQKPYPTRLSKTFSDYQQDERDGQQKITVPALAVDERDALKEGMCPLAGISAIFFSLSFFSRRAVARVCIYARVPGVAAPLRVAPTPRGAHTAAIGAKPPEGGGEPGEEGMLHDYRYGVHSLLARYIDYQYGYNVAAQFVRAQ